MARDLYDRQYRGVTPVDTADPPRFGQPVETVKDAFVSALTDFFTRSTQVSTLGAELPTVRKYTNRGSSAGVNYETLVAVLRKNPGLFEQLPHVIVSGATSTDVPLAVGPRVAGVVQRPPRIDCALAEPYALVDGDRLVIRTRGKNAGLPGPFGGTGSLRPSELVTIPFGAGWFTDIAAATAAEVVDVINAYGGPYNLRAVVINIGTALAPSYAFRVLTAGGTPNEIEIDTASTDSALAAFDFGRRGVVDSIAGTAPDMLLNDAAATFTAADVGRYIVTSGTDATQRNDGRFLISVRNSATQIGYTSAYGVAETPSGAATWFIGLRDDSTNVTRPPMRRLLRAATVSLRIDIVAEDENGRVEVADLVDSALNFFLERNYFALLGRSVLDDDAATTTAGDAAPTGEHYTITIQPPVQRSGETEVPRPGDAENKVYMDGFDVIVSFVEALDREAYVPGVTPVDPWVVRADDLVPDDTLAEPGAEEAPADTP